MLFAYHKHIDDNGTTLRFELRDDGDPNVDEVPASTMWSILLPILLDFEELVQAYSGMVYDFCLLDNSCNGMFFNWHVYFIKH